MREAVDLGVAHTGLARTRREGGAVQVEKVSAPDRAQGVGGREERHGVLADPGEPVEAALVTGALGPRARAGLLAVLGDPLGAAGVVGADVEQTVETPEGRRQIGVRLGEVLRRPAQVALERLSRTRE